MRPNRIPDVEIDSTATRVPQIGIEASKDSMRGWNIHLKTKNFKFAPDKAGGEDVMNEGHAYIFVNGKKSARIYGDWFHLTLSKGINKVKVVLTTNSHKNYYFKDQPIAVEVGITEDREVSIKDHEH